MNIEDIYQEQIESIEKYINIVEKNFFKEISRLEGTDIERDIACGNGIWSEADEVSKEILKKVKTLPAEKLAVSKDRIVASYPFSVSRNLVSQIIIRRMNQELNTEDIPKRYIRK